MKYKIALSSLLWSSLALAAPSTWDVSVLAGGVLTDTAINIDDQAVVGAALQYNGFDFFLSPEIEVLQSTDTYFETADGTDGDAYINRIMLNAVYDLDLDAAVTPYVKAGVGFESFFGSNNAPGNNGPFGDLGAGLKLAFTDELSARVEGLYMRKFFTDEGGVSTDNNYALLAGLTYSFITEETHAEKAAEPTRRA